jgi:hypothetical protein
VDEPEQDVLGADVVVVEHLGLFLGQDDNATSSVGETLEHVIQLPVAFRCRVQVAPIHREYRPGSWMQRLFALGVTPIARACLATT